MVTINGEIAENHQFTPREVGCIELMNGVSARISYIVIDEIPRYGLEYHVGVIRELEKRFEDLDVLGFLSSLQYDNSDLTIIRDSEITYVDSYIDIPEFSYPVLVFQDEQGFYIEKLETWDSETSG